MTKKHLIRDLLQDTIAMSLTVETTDGCVYSGTVKELDDYFNVIMENVEVENESGHCKFSELVLRGSSIRLIRLPDIL